MAIPPALAALVAGSLGGAVGVGAAFPFDTLKTKAQVYSFGQGKEDQARGVGMKQIIIQVLKTEGLGGFYGGVSTMMVGQAFIKAVAFSANSAALDAEKMTSMFASLSPLAQLTCAALFSGFVTSFLVNPIERIKIMCQAAEKGTYKSELECARIIIGSDGIKGFLFRGLGPTILRETPSYGIYFVIYSQLMNQQVIQGLGMFAPLLAGALSGCACWLPVYPMDVIKTTIQNTDGKTRAPTTIETAYELYTRGGIGVFLMALKARCYEQLQIMQ
ncbi:hypothetical protein GUITHDRAFT_157468 [Guillardia theta CCMP2712]|uniref:Mitochondrial carrier protein n=1 Tax=Guillardia theta (strain CCMP2712) TaxID=905079 RepID=L1JLI8_GUITC|nr:hypothetical protein GUITHDRAFT_157468 [Guillardia theta CCMP2712]EKX49217.1 hypothetical protein GUITHDRAFT_157468 [Guillardia theta CCMP2712]|eukprot:XP_005836197.1 hypothetical protein GUITHDRAFT_157468 [Guillardia theta CCMP2712]